MELCERGADGFDRNGWLHLLVLSNELCTPKILICPKDHSRKAQTNFAQLGPQNVTYRVRSGAEINKTNEHTVLAVCPVDGNMVRCDGRVFDSKGQEHRLGMGHADGGNDCN